MAAPVLYKNDREYLEDVIDFLQTYRWIYAFPNTHILTNKVFDKLPSEWLPFLRSLTTDDVNKLARGDIAASAPTTLLNFINKINKLKFTASKHISKENLKFVKPPGLNRKKEHEIISFAPLIHEICQKNKCDSIIDVGTGLGHLPRFLYDRYRYRSLAIEGSSEKFNLAKTHQLKYLDSQSSIEYFEHFLTEESGYVIQEQMNKLSVSRACMTGLHACADLSVTVLKLFLELEYIKCLVIMPCCYHRLKRNDDGFINFPVSDVLKEIVEKYDSESFLNVPFLRLACQWSVDGFSNMTENEHQKHANSCLFRAILQEVVDSEYYQVRRLKRKSGKLKQLRADVDPFEVYLSNLKYTHTLIGGEITDHQFLKKMREKWTEHKRNAYLVEALSAFQAAMQNICENLVLLDRVIFLKEKGLECFVVKVTDQGISPRCHALVAVKP